MAVVILTVLLVLFAALLLRSRGHGFNSSPVTAAWNSWASC